MGHPYGCLSIKGNGCRHNWANQASRIDVEIYPKLEQDWMPNPTAGVVCLDFTADQFDHPAHGGLYSSDVGLVLLPLKGFSPYVYGYVTLDGEPVPDSIDVGIQLFGHTGHHEISSKGHPIYGQVSAGVVNKSYKTGPLLTGVYEIRVTVPDDRDTIVDYINVFYTKRFDIFIQGMEMEITEVEG